MLTHKINELNAKTEAKNYKIKPYEETLKPHSLYKLQKMQCFFDEGSKQRTGSLKHK